MNQRNKIKYGTFAIEYNLTFQERKSLGIKVFPDCSVYVTAPCTASFEKIQEKIKKKATWILKQQKEFLSFQPLTPARSFVNGETHLYLGRQYKLRLETGNKNEVRLLKGRLIIYTNKTTPPQKILDKWYKEKAYIHFRNTLNNALLLFIKYHISKPEIQIRNMKKRWGSCTPNGKIILNPALIKAPKGSIEYVIIHELCHLVHYNHTKAFYELQGKIMPDWKKWKERLEYSLA